MRIAVLGASGVVGSALALELEQHARLGAVTAEPGVLGPEARQAPSRIGMRTPLASATSSARS